MSEILICPRILPPLDPDFQPAALWNRAFLDRVNSCNDPAPLTIALEQTSGTVSVHKSRILPEDHPDSHLNWRYLERIVKFLLWQKGGWKISLSGPTTLTQKLRDSYAPDGERKFDSDIIGKKVYGNAISVEAAESGDGPTEQSSSLRLGRHLEGCRIGFDLGGSDRKCAAVIDGHPVHSEEIPWNPYFQKDPQYHIDGIQDSIKRAAAKLPRVDAIGGSAAGIYVNNEVRVASLFRGVPEEIFDKKVRGIFRDLASEWNVPFEVVNDGEVTALAGSMASGTNSVLGIAMGTSLAAGYVDPQGGITTWLNELAFAPVDYRPEAPVDEWSGDAGCGVQYFSQQAVARLCGPAGIDYPEDMPFSEILIMVQELMEKGDKRAEAIYKTIGVYLGYTIAHYAEFYDINQILLLGRVMTGQGGELIINGAQNVLATEFSELAQQVSCRIPDEQEKRHGQAVAAASLPVISGQ